MNLVDIHCHLDHEDFSNDLDKVIDESKKAGVNKVITSGVNKSTNRKALELSKKYNIVKPSFGIYPLDALASITSIENSNINSSMVEKFDLDKELAWIEKNKDKCLAIGECGLDYKYIKKKELREKQKQVFIKVIELANKINKPLIIHCRRAEADAIKILSKNSQSRQYVILHCFHGNKNLIKKAIDLGYYLSIPPIIKRSEHFQMLVKMVPINHLLTETDSPFLSSKRGNRNTPQEVKITINEIAKIKDIDKNEVANQIYNNYKKIF